MITMRRHTGRATKLISILRDFRGSDLLFLSGGQLLLSHERQQRRQQRNGGHHRAHLEHFFFFYRELIVSWFFRVYLQTNSMSDLWIRWMAGTAEAGWPQQRSVGPGLKATKGVLEVLGKLLFANHGWGGNNVGWMCFQCYCVPRWSVISKCRAIPYTWTVFP